MIKYAKNIPRFLIGKHLRLHRILMNLLGNAFKFTEQGAVELQIEQISKSKKDEILLKFSVIDTGIGIPKDKQQIIFKPFERLQSSYQGKYPGSGLGLSLVMDYAEKMQGEIQLHSEENKGSTFICILPFQQDKQSKNKKLSQPKDINIATDTPVNSATTTEADSPSPIDDNLSQALIVEDNLLAQKIGMLELKKAGYLVTCAISGEEAVKLCCQKKYNLIYMDIGLPGIDGIEATRQIRTSSESLNKFTVIVALSAHVDEEITQKSIETGIQIVQQKPLTEDKVNEAYPLVHKDKDNNNE